MNTFLNGVYFENCNQKLEAVSERLKTVGVQLIAKKCHLLNTETLHLDSEPEGHRNLKTKQEKGASN